MKTIPKPHADNGFEDYPYFTLLDIEKMMSKKELKMFGVWIYGQTCPVVNGQCCYYAEDVLRFLKMKREKVPTYFD